MHGKPDEHSFWSEGYQLMLDSVLYTAECVIDRDEYLNEFFNKACPTPVTSINDMSQLVCVSLFFFLTYCNCLSFTNNILILLLLCLYSTG